MKKITGTVLSSNGLTARLSAQLVAEANQFKSDLIITVFDEDADLKSIMNVMALVVPQGTEYNITIRGKDEDAAYKAFCKLLKELNLLS